MAGLIQELETMKKRIEELESQVRKLQNQVAAAPKPEPAKPVVATANPPAFTSPLETPDQTPPTPQQTPPLTPQQTSPAPQQTSPQQTSTATQQAESPRPAEPFAFADWTWLTGNPRITESPGETKFFTPEIRADVDYVYDYNHPADHTIGGSSEVFRAGEVQVTQFGVGGDFHWENVRARLMTQFGMYAETTPRNDASPAVGAWDLLTAYRYVSEAYGGYHFNVMHGINVDAGIFLSYIGLFSYYQFDNWAYQPSYVSSNTPWFFNGVRIQLFPTEKLKIEPWFINGWQSYGKFNKAPGLGVEILYRPTPWLSVVANQYEGTDTLGVPGRHRIHTDDSVQIKYYENPKHLIDRAAMTVTLDAGCEFGQNSGVSCYSGTAAKPSQYFLGFMTYQRIWLHHDLFGITIGGGAINNPGRYLVLLPPINGATAITGSPYFPENPGDPFKAWDASLTFDYMPRQYITWRFEYGHRASNVPYFTGPGGITPAGGVTGTPGVIVPGFTPDLVKRENRLIFAVLVMF
jgi:Putative beta-barrel porin-2, OmpL-like. bbp2